MHLSIIYLVFATNIQIHLKHSFSSHDLQKSHFLFLFIYSFRFPCFWGVWVELVDLVQKRADFIRILQTSKQTIFHLLFWLSFSNSRQDVLTHILYLLVGYVSFIPKRGSLHSSFFLVVFSISTSKTTISSRQYFGFVNIVKNRL